MSYTKTFAILVSSLVTLGLVGHSHAQTIGAGIGILDLADANNTVDTPSDGANDQSRQNLDISFTAMLDPGHYSATSWSFRAGQTGSVIPYLAVGTDVDKVYQVIQVGDQVNIDDAGLDQDMTVDFSSAYSGFTLNSPTEVFAGIVNPTVGGSQNPIYTNLASGSMMDHDNNSDGLQSPGVIGGSVEGFGHANLPRSYAFSIDVATSADPGPAAANVNFGPDAVLDTATYPEFTGYLGDNGSAYGNQGNGFRYGWLNGLVQPDPQDEQRNRDNADSPDERYDTVNHMIKGDNNSWQIDLPNGDYDILLVAGDPNHTDQVNDLVISGGDSPLIVDDPDGQDNFDEHELSYSVTQGYLRISPNPGDDLGKNQKLTYINIVPEPGSMSMAVVGMLAVLGMLRRRKR